MRVKHKIEEILREIIYKKWKVELPSSLEKPNNPAFGDYALPLFPISKKLKISVQDIGNNILKELIRYGDISAQVVGGFLNFRVSFSELVSNLREVLKEKENYGFLKIGKGKKILMEFISANPTGPLNIANARAGAIGDTLCNLFKNAGFSVEREYYVNDGGEQIQQLKVSVEARISELKGQKVEFPEQGYPGEYIKDIAREHLKSKEKDALKFAIQKIHKNQKKTLKRFRINFDRFVFESKFRKERKIQEFLKAIKDLSYKKDSAIYFKSTEYGDTQDRVIIKSNKEYTYFLIDLMYHQDKINRGYDYLINIWGPDHHGYIPRMKAGIQSLGFSLNKFEVIIAQQVHLLKDRKRVGMSKRKGIYYTLDELLDEVGVDAVRFFMLLRAPGTPLEFDISLAKETKKENPVYYLQYMHARTCNVSEFASNKGIKRTGDFNEEILSGEKEKNILRKFMEFPDILEKASLLRAPHLLPHFLLELAHSYHSFYQSERIVGGLLENTNARLALNDACKWVIYKGLNLMGVSAPERME